MLNNAKAQEIIECGLRLLDEKGNQGLTMRGVATKAGISLGNLQYHFKDKDQLLKGMIDFYLAQCSNVVNSKEISEVVTANITQSQLEELLHLVLNNEDMKGLCRTFREFWAISTRNEEIDKYLHHYYLLLVGH